MKPAGSSWVGRDVSLLWAGQIISQAGDSVYQIAMIWLMLQMTGSGSMTGLGAMTAYLPVLIFGLFAGVVSDRFDRRRVMIIADAARTALVLVVPMLWFTHALTPLRLAAVTFLVGSFATLFNPARDSLVPDIAPPGKLELANSLIQTSWQLAMFMGPALAGLLIPVVGLIHLFEFDAATFLVSMGAVLLITRSAGRMRRSGAPAGGPDGAASSSLLEGFGFAWRDRRIRLLIILTFVYNFLLMGIPLVATPIFVREVLDNRPETFAWLQAVYAGGMVVGAPLAVFLSKRMKKGSLLMAGIILDGLTFCPLFFASTKWAALLLMLLHSIFIPLIVVPRTTLIQRIVGRSMWGRIFAMMSVAVTGASSLSAALTGVVCDLMDVRWVILLFGCLSAAVGAAGFLSRDLRNADA